MLLSNIKKLSDKKAKTKNPAGKTSTNTYGVGLPPPALGSGSDTLPPEEAGDDGSDGGAE